MQRFFRVIKIFIRWINRVKWNSILLESKYDGLGVGCLGSKNLILLGKWKWRFKKNILGRSKDTRGTRITNLAIVGNKMFITIKDQQYVEVDSSGYSFWEMIGGYRLIALVIVFRNIRKWKWRFKKNILGRSKDTRGTRITNLAIGGNKKFITIKDQQYVENLPKIGWGKHTRVILDVGCSVASFGGHLLDKYVITMSFAPKDENEAQIQFAPEQGIPATLSMIGTQRLTFPDNAFDLIHCTRCRVVGFAAALTNLPLWVMNVVHVNAFTFRADWCDMLTTVVEMDRILRPGGVVIVEDTIEMLKKLKPIMRSLHWSTSLPLCFRRRKAEVSLPEHNIMIS
ncbi:probable methyltransferase PMT23 [Tanacetum coccineum]|uniref:Methyltransferase n=1 Tax=Tanacetum coccineum TaxID=301880 RepID=A0ABQ5IIF7_9ASTR